uniref:Uncharacterized protein n=1 Tax=Arion vulgaris TaxID=1028688 RepID=A0A0B7BM02_9EUPU
MVQVNRRTVEEESRTLNKTTSSITMKTNAVSDAISWMEEYKIEAYSESNRLDKYDYENQYRQASFEIERVIPI